MMRKTVFLFLFCWYAIFVQAQNKEFDSIANYVEQNNTFEYHTCRGLIEDLYQMAHQSPDSLKLLTTCIGLEARLCYAHSKMNPLLENKIRQYLWKLDSAENVRERNILEYALGMSYLGNKNYGEAFVIMLPVLEKFKQLNDSVYVAKSLGLLGDICRSINQFYLGNEYFTEQLNWVEENSVEYFLAKQNQYLLLGKEGQYRQLIDSLEYLVEKSKKVLPEYMAINQYLNLSYSYLLIDSLDMAHDYFQKTQELVEQIDSEDKKIAFLFYYATYLKQIGELQGALNYYRMAYQKSIQNDNHFLKIISIGTAIVFEDMNEKDSAISYLWKHYEIYCDERMQSQAINIHQQYIANYLTLTENQLAIAQQAVSLRNKQLALAVVSIVFGAFLLLTLLIITRQRRARKKAEQNAKTEAEREALERQIEYEKELNRAELEKQQEIIDLKERELFSYALLETKNSDLRKEILKLTAQIKEGKEDAGHIAEKINAIVWDDFHLDNDWEKFHLRFKNVHPHFFEHLRAIKPDLTEENLRMCAYFKIGLTNREIANLLHVLPQSIANQRMRIKKKLGLSDEDSLDNFLREV